jgi:hypothetical protein
MSDTASKKLCIESEVTAELRELAANANKRRERIRQEIQKLNQSSVLSSKDTPPPDLVSKFSSPAFDTKLPFPFVQAVPERFDIGDGDDEKNWFYMGREKFAELKDNFEYIRRASRHRALIVYGTRGYGKSHLLAALVCHLAAGEDKVVFIPDCRALRSDPVPYMKAAMLFAWAGDEATQQLIMELKNENDIYWFFQGQKNVIFVIDQLNALEEKKKDNKSKAAEKARLHQWLDRLWAKHKAVLSSSANNHTILNEQPQQNNIQIMHVYGGLTKVSLKSNNSFVKK